MNQAQFYTMFYVLQQYSDSSKVFHTPFDLPRFLNYSVDAEGKITKGIATSMTWLGQIDVDAINQPDSISGVGLPVCT